MSPIDVESLVSQRSSATEMAPLSGQGVYVYFLNGSDALPGISAAHHGLLYVGMTEDGLDARNHFGHVHSGFSTFRRSLGAILKDELKLSVVPRSSGRSKSNFRCYRFTDVGEAMLTDWMHGNLLCSQAEVQGDVGACERMLIAELRPPLNLKGWPNPQARHIKLLRSECAREAEEYAARVSAC